MFATQFLEVLYNRNSRPTHQNSESCNQLLDLLIEKPINQPVYRPSGLSVNLWISISNPKDGKNIQI